MKPRYARCPACSKLRDVDGQRALREVEVTWFEGASAGHPSPDDPFRPLEDGMRRLALEGHPRWTWACDACLKAGRALVADPRQQSLGMGTPMAAYIERPFRCEDCGADAVFGAGEQRRWYEELGFIIWSHPRQCGPCRAARRRRKQTNEALAEALGALDPTDPDQLESVAALYDELGSPKKAETFRARAKNRRK